VKLVCDCEHDRQTAKIVAPPGIVLNGNRPFACSDQPPMAVFKLIK
jgi:hypothetical protein